jgi:hypothetical protein
MPDRPAGFATLPLVLLGALSCASTVPASPGDIDDPIAQRWYYSEANKAMKEGHRQVRRWKAAFDSARQVAKAQVYGPVVAPSTGSSALGRSLATTTTAAPTPLGTEATFAGGQMKGRWVLDRVSNTTASGGYGSGVRVDRTAYDSATNTLHALTEEGNLVSAPLAQMGSWRVVNQVVQIDKASFVGVPTAAGTYRLVGVVGTSFVYSDDAGLTWTTSTGGTVVSGSCTWAATLPTGEILALAKRGSLLVLLRSKDQGTTYGDVQTWSTGTTLGTALYNSADTCFVVVQTSSATNVYRYGAGALVQAGTLPTTSKVTSMTGTVSGGKIRVYARTADSTGWSSADGATWTRTAGFAQDLQTVFPDKPDVVMSNGAEHELTQNAGASWAAYPNNDGTIGWDPHHLAFYRVAGKWTLVAANDMGLCFNDDPLNGATWRYVNKNHSFAILHGGSAVDNMALTLTENQDPGTFELGRTARDTFLATNRQGADGLRGAPSNGGKAYWYRHYWASYMHAHAASTGDTRTASYDIDGDWYTPPFKGSTKSGEDAIWVSGWSNLVKLTYASSTNKVTRTDLAKNFTTDAGAVTIGVGVAKSDPSRLYVTTRNGRFFWSKDTGATWTETTYSGTKPTPPWQDWNSASGLYIEVCDKDPDLVFWGGGTGATAVLVSRDGGKTFTSTVSGMPSGSEVRNVSLAPDGKLAFSSNYQVWVAADNKWYDLRTASMPSAALPSANALQYLPLQRKVRYFTWGAGVVDLDITSLNTTDNPAVSFADNSCYQLKSVSSGKSLVATSAGKVVQATWTGNLNQIWRLVPQEQFFRLENAADGSVLEVAAASTKDGAAVQTAAWSGADAQQWNAVRAGTDYAFAARHSVKALEIAGSSTADSAKADQGVYTEAANQKWTLVQASTCGSSPVRKGVREAPVRLVAAGRGKFRIEGLQSPTAHVLVWDNAGRVAWRGTVSGELDLSGLEKGLFHVRIWSGNLDYTLEAAVLP